MEDPLKILMLEDVPEDAWLVERILKKSDLIFESRRVDTREEFINAITKYCPDIILSDHSLPQFNSIEALKLCKFYEHDVPFILVTGTVSEEFAVNALKEGADDYILKGNLTRLPSAIQNALKQKEAERERRKVEIFLKEQNAELIKINKELDKFVYSASHDLRAPLKSVLGLINLAEDDDRNKRYDSMKVYHQMMRKSIYKLDATIMEIIDYSRNARNEMLIEEVNVMDIINESWQNLQYMEGKGSVDLSISIQSDKQFFSDPKRIQIILSNIFSNSIRYQDSDKKACVHVNIDITEKTAVFTIEDNGIGIEPAYLHKIFDMFYRASEKSDGSGLGLYIVKETVEKLQGTISVHSEYGKGTTFIIEIPNLNNQLAI